jgi:RsiW-degrading membrane proteinase PrsW (M82 family)
LFCGEKSRNGSRRRGASATAFVLSMFLFQILLWVQSVYCSWIIIQFNFCNPYLSNWIDSVCLDARSALALTFHSRVNDIYPGAVILSLTYYLYRDRVTIGQMLVSFFETIMWMVPLLIWDLIWVLGIAPQLKEEGLCGLCILAYLLQSYFFAGFCEEVVKFKVISRLSDSPLSSDWRALMVYGLCSGCGFATAENLSYVLSYGYPVAIFRAFAAVPLHCCTGAIIGLHLSQHQPLSSSWISLAKGLLSPSSCQHISPSE